MAILVRIHLPDRSEYKKIIRTKKDSFTWKNDTYHLDYNKGYFTRIYGGFIKIVVLDYEKGKEEPIGYFALSKPNVTELRPNYVSQVIRNLIEQIPNFQLIVIIMLIAILAMVGICIFFSYNANSNSENIKNLCQNIYNVTRSKY